LARFFPWLTDETPLLQPVSDADGPAPESGVLGVMDVIGPKFFDTLAVPLLHGRDFDSRDTAGGQPVAILNRAAAERIFRSTNVVGRSIRVGSSPGRQRLLIVGVSPDFTLGNPRSVPPATIFRSAGQEQGLAKFPTLIVSSRAGAFDLSALKNAVLAEGQYYVAESQTIDDRLAMAVSTERGLTRVAIGFGGLALLIAIVSLHAITSRVCSMRRQEFGIRLALGQPRSTIMRGVLLATLKDVAAGLVAGAGLSIAMFKVLGGATLSLTPLGWSGAAALTMIFGLSAVVAGLLPAIRAARVDPATLLRES
jgi:putative ABC transport system permease protein